MNHHIARRAFHDDASARVFIQRLAVLLERTVHGRHLSDRAGELLLHCSQALGGDLAGLHSLLLQHLQPRFRAFLEGMVR